MAHGIEYVTKEESKRISDRLISDNKKMLERLASEEKIIQKNSPSNTCNNLETIKIIGMPQESSTEIKSDQFQLNTAKRNNIELVI